MIAVLVAGCESGSGSETSSTSTTTRRSTTTTVAAQPPTTTDPYSGPPELAAVKGRIIVVDAGHAGGNSSHTAEISRDVFIGTQNRDCDATGTQTASGYTEHEFTLDVALRLRDLLTAAGANVVMVRTDDTGWGPCIDDRAEIGNRSNAEAGISIHADGGPTGGRGFHVNIPANIPGYTDDIYAASKALGVAFRDVYTAETGIPVADYFGQDGLAERDDFGGLNLSNVPKVLFETGNMQNSSDAALLESPDERQKIAHALALGFARYFVAQAPQGGSG